MLDPTLTPPELLTEHLRDPQVIPDLEHIALQLYLLTMTVRDLLTRLERLERLDDAPFFSRP
jgi:hypothetical protein